MVTNLRREDYHFQFWYLIYIKTWRRLTVLCFSSLLLAVRVASSVGLASLRFQDKYLNTKQRKP